VNTRTYNNSRRKEMEVDTIRRIISSTVELHAQKGALATTHAEIAEAAGVSVATVYKHFPSREALIPHCTGMVGEQAPQIDVQAILKTPQREEQLRLLVRALHRQYRYFHPWMRWAPRDVPALPVLAQFIEESSRQTENLVRAVLDHTAGAPVSDETFALAMVILDYHAWQRLDRMLNDPERISHAAEQALQLLMSQFLQQKGRK
jgi:AcrR family transcriptional regulator